MPKNEIAKRPRTPRVLARQGVNIAQLFAAPAPDGTKPLSPLVQSKQLEAAAKNKSFGSRWMMALGGAGTTATITVFSGPLGSFLMGKSGNPVEGILVCGAAVLGVVSLIGGAIKMNGADYVDMPLLSLSRERLLQWLSARYGFQQEFLSHRMESSAVSFALRSQPNGARHKLLEDENGIAYELVSRDQTFTVEEVDPSISRREALAVAAHADTFGRAPAVALLAGEAASLHADIVRMANLLSQQELGAAGQHALRRVMEDTRTAVDTYGHVAGLGPVDSAVLTTLSSTLVTLRAELSGILAQLQAEGVRMLQAQATYVQERFRAVGLGSNELLQLTRVDGDGHAEESVGASSTPS